MNTKTPKIQGVVKVFLNERGQVIAHAADFDRGGYGGFTLQQSQAHRVDERLGRAVIDAYSSPDLSRALSRFNVGDMMRTLVNQYGCKVHEINIGHDEESP